MARLEKRTQMRVCYPLGYKPIAYDHNTHNGYKVLDASVSHLKLEKSHLPINKPIKFTVKFDKKTVEVSGKVIKHSPEGDMVFQLDLPLTEEFIHQQHTRYSSITDDLGHSSLVNEKKQAS